MAKSNYLTWAVLKAHTEFRPRHDLVDAWLTATLEPLETRELDAIRIERARVRVR